MNNATTWLAIAAAASSLGLAGVAQAKASASGEFRNLSFTLFDLNPMDGIAPGFTLGAGSHSVGEAYVRDYASSLFPHDSATGSGTFAPLAVSAATPLGAASAKITGGGTMGSAVAAASVWVAGDGAVTNFASGNALPTSGTFTLTPWTAVRFDADATVNARTTIGRDGLKFEYASARAYFQISVHGDGTHEQYDSSREANASYRQVWDPVAGVYKYSGQSVDSTGALSLTYANAAALESTVNFHAGTQAFGQSSLAVPEPETYALMLAGLGVLGLVVRRRRGN